jgi:hypothetical protein
MSETVSPDRLAAEFDCLLARAGMPLPAARRGVVLAAYAELRGQMALLQRRYGATAEPANVFRLTPFDSP